MLNTASKVGSSIVAPLLFHCKLITANSDSRHYITLSDTDNSALMSAITINIDHTEGRGGNTDH